MKRTVSTVLLAVLALAPTLAFPPPVTVYVTRTGTKYHVLGCRYLRQSKIAMELSEARKRFDPCSVCNP